MKVILILITSTFLLGNVIAQEKKCTKNTGTSYISGNDFTNVLLEKNYNTIADINFKNENTLYHWGLKSNNLECKLCDNVYANLSLVFHNDNSLPTEVVMRYIIRPSTNEVVINYTYNIINEYAGNSLVTKLVEVNGGVEKIIYTHNNPENKSIEKSIRVVPGRSYYVDIVANYVSQTVKTIFQFDNLKITEQILSGSLVFNHNIP